MINKLLLVLFTSLSSSLALGQDAPVAKREISIILDILGAKGVMIVIGVAVFMYTYVNSVKLFAWIDDQTYGTRDYILKKFEIMFIEVEPHKITWALLFMSFGMGIITFCIIAALGNTVLASVRNLTGFA